MKHTPLISVREVACAPRDEEAAPKVEVEALDLHGGAVTVLSGDRASGHARLLRLLGLIARPDRGEVVLAGQATTELSDEKRAAIRSTRCGYLFASPFLLPSLTVLENVAMPMFKICAMTPDEARERSEDLLQFSGVPEFARPSELSLDSQYRVALARALAHRPAAVFVEDFDRVLQQAADGDFAAHLAAAAARYDVAIVGAAGPGFMGGTAVRRLAMTAGRIVGEAQP